jgi:hypothetical protein
MAVCYSLVLDLSFRQNPWSGDIRYLDRGVWVHWTTASLTGHGELHDQGPLPGKGPWLPG